MAKYIGTYATSGDVQTALDNQELSRPFIAYTTDNNKVIYGPTADRAEVGDIVVYSVADDLLHYIKKADYNTTSYPAASYEPVGVVAYPQNDDAILGPSGEITFMGLSWLEKTKPDYGDKGNGYHGETFMVPRIDVPELTNYTSSGTAITDMNGKANTEIYLTYATGQTDWRTASAITIYNLDGIVPACELAWRYHTSGTVQGDWYIPAAGQVYGSIMSYFDLINESLTLANGAPFQNNNKNIWSSTENGTAMWCLYDSLDFMKTYDKASANFVQARPFCSKLMTRI